MVSFASSSIASVRTYTAYQPTTNTYDLFAQRLDAAGDSVGVPILVSEATFPDTNATLGLATVLKNGGFVVTYDSEDPTSPFGGYTTVVKQYDANGAASGNIATLGPFTFLNNVDSQQLLLANGGFAILSTNNQPFVAADESLTDVTLLIGTPGHGITSLPVSHFETDSGTPLPSLIQTHPTLSAGPNDTVLVSFNRYYTAANPDFPTNDPPGEQHFQQIYDDDGQLVSLYFRDFNGTAETTTYDAAGHVSTEYTRHPDGSFDTQAYGLIGKAYVDQEASYDTSGHVLSMTRHYADGSLALRETATSTETWAKDGSHIIYHADGTIHYIDSYNVAGNLVSQDIQDLSNGSHIRSNFAPTNGYLEEDQSFYADGSKRITDYDFSGGFKTVDIDRTGFVTSVTHTSTQGGLVADTYQHDGRYSHTETDMFGRQSVSIEGDGHSKTVVTSDWGSFGNATPAQMIEHATDGIVTDREFLTATSDRIAIYAAGISKTAGVNATIVGSPLGSDSFVFGETVGHADLANFVSGNGANHDVIELHAASLTNFADLQSHLTLTGNGTLISLTLDDTILLKGVAPAALTAANFSFN